MRHAVHCKRTCVQVDDLKCSIKFQLKKVLCMGVAVANVGMSERDIYVNTQVCTSVISAFVACADQSCFVISMSYVRGSAHHSIRLKEIELHKLICAVT